MTIILFQQAFPIFFVGREGLSFWGEKGGWMQGWCEADF